MLRPFFIGAILALSAPASAATFANFDALVGVTLQATPAQELYEEGGYLPGSETIITSGDFTLITGDDGNPGVCCNGGFVPDTNPNYMGEIGLSAEGAVNSAGSVFAEGERRAVWTFSNRGASTESISLTFDIAMSITQAIDPMVGGTAASGAYINIFRDGSSIYSEALDGFEDEFAVGTAINEPFVYNFDLPASGDTETQFTFFVGGYVDVSNEVAPVPLPAGAVLLLSGLGALGVHRRMRR
ncbi:VPLPA-CTERM sorting domain-containing protein [Gymnodinialimonas sp. 2305UL16-5]|uniref:VPLPA-CTERM sorting domain-containing protein n=1 Tax=Gymnodinialimonas mytili TaxID=3126503 RepID=UPI00309DAAF4